MRLSGHAVNNRNRITSFFHHGALMGWSSAVFKGVKTAIKPDAGRDGNEPRVKANVLQLVVEVSNPQTILVRVRENRANHRRLRAIQLLGISQFEHIVIFALDSPLQPQPF